MIDTEIKDIDKIKLNSLISEKILYQELVINSKKNINFLKDNPSRISFIEKERIINKNKYHVNELLSYYDEDFIKNVYRALLKREFDQEGYDYYLSKLRSIKLHRLEIISRIYFSKECKKKNIKLNGLYLRLFFRILYRIPILGYILRLIISVVRLPRIVKNQEELEVQVMSEINFLKNKINENLIYKNDSDKKNISLINNNFNEIIKLISKKRADNEL